MDNDDEISDLSAIYNEEMTYEGEGEAHNAVGSIGQRNPPETVLSDLHLQRHHYFNSDGSSNSFESENEMERSSSSSDIGIDAVTCPQPVCSSSPIQSYSYRSMLEFSKVSQSRDASGFEGQGGDLSVVDPIVLQTEISQLKFENAKLLEDNANLTKQISAADEAQIHLQAQNESLSKQLGQYKVDTEKMKKMTRDLEEAKIELSRHEDRNLILTKRIKRLEKDYNELQDSTDVMREEMVSLEAEIEKYRSLTKNMAEEINDMSSFSNDKILCLETSVATCEDRIDNLNTTVSELTKMNDQLRMEKQELELSLLDASHLNSLSHFESRLVSLDDTACTTDLMAAEEEDLISLRGSSCTPAPNSIHAEIAASMGKEKTSCLPEFRHDSLICYATSEISSPWDPASVSDFTHRMRCILSEILEELEKIRMEYYMSSNSEKGEKEQNAIPSQDTDGFQEIKTSQPCKESEMAVEQKPTEGISGPETTAEKDMEKEVDVVQRIHEELAEFRAQLKKSQDLFHAFSSNQSFSVTKSCPLLADDSGSETNVLKPQYVTCSTQTDIPVIASSSQTTPNIPHQTNEDSETLSEFMGKESLDDNELDKLSLDEDSYRLTINLPTVLEESEHETETSPAAAQRMSSEKINRPPLIRMPKTSADEPIRSDEEGVKSDNASDLFYSAPSSIISSRNPSTYNSLERPLKISGLGGCQSDDRASVVSDEHTTYGSPMSSPSSPTFWTPSQGSSQETITNHDGDKTPVNEDEHRFRDSDTASCPPDFYEQEINMSNSLVRKRAVPIDKPKLPIDDRSKLYAKGVIPDTDHDRMTTYAFDTVKRSIDKDAGILARSEWRTLRQDLGAQGLLQYNRSFAQEAGGDGDNLDGEPRHSDNTIDLDDEAEEYAFETNFPDVVDNLFKSLDNLKLKGRDLSLTKEEFENISTRFDKLSNVFKTDHMELPKRVKQSTKEYQNVQNRIDELIASLKSSVEKINESPSPAELQDVLRSMEYSSQELQIRSNELSKKAKRVGRLDLQTRVYKMIEVMILYVHILQNYENPTRVPILAKKPPLGENNVESPTKASNGKIPSSNNNNNNNEKMSWTEGYLGEGRWMERWVGEGLDFIRRELSWPWNWEQTWKGVKQCFSILLMLVGLLIIFKSVFPIVSADNSSCGSPPHSVLSAISAHGSLIHEKPPTL